MSTMTLLPCPFCGGEPEIVRAQDEDGRFAAVGCPHCGAGSRQHYFVGDDAVPHVVSAWNRRAHVSQPAQAVDVGAIREVIESHRCVARLAGENDLRLRDTSNAWADKLARALSGEKAGPVVRITVDSVAMAGCDDACQVWLRSGVQHFQVGPAYETRDEGEWYASQLRIALGLPASPAPDKEG